MLLWWFIYNSSVFCLFCPVAEVQAIANLIEKQARIVVKHKVSEEPKTMKEGKEALLAQYANITDDEQYPFGLLPLVFHSGHARSFDRAEGFIISVHAPCRLSE